MFTEGQKIQYVGHPVEGLLDIGDIGMVIAAGNTASGVKWETGRSAGRIEEVPHYEITPVVSRRADTDTFGSRLVTIAVRDIHDTDGPDGLLDALNGAGHLGNFTSFAEEALRSVTTMVRSDPSIMEVLAELDSEEAEEFVGLAAMSLLQDAFGRGDES